MEAVADHQPVALVVKLAAMGLHIGRHLAQQRRRQHLPSTVSAELIQHRPAGLVGL